VTCRARLPSSAGQSGILGSPHYDDLIQPWLNGEYHPLLWTRSRLKARSKENWYWRGSAKAYCKRSRIFACPTALPGGSSYAGLAKRRARSRRQNRPGSSHPGVAPQCGREAGSSYEQLPLPPQPAPGACDRLCRSRKRNSRQMKARPCKSIRRMSSPFFSSRASIMVREISRVSRKTSSAY